MPSGRRPPDSPLQPLDVHTARPVLDALPYPTLWVAPDHTVRWMNAAAHREWGCARAGLPCYVLAHGYDRPCDALGETCPKRLAEGEGSTIEAVHAHLGVRGESQLTRVVAVPVAGSGVLEMHLPLGSEVSRDPLSGLLRRESWLELAHRDRALLRRIGSPYSVLFADIDHFKRFNDTFGHLVGDRVLRVVAGTIQERMRLCDSAGRFGGEEFVVFMPHTSAHEAVQAAERVRRAVAGAILPVETGGATLTVSIGVHTAYPEETLTDSVAAADAAMYRAKAAGRDRVRLSRGSLRER